MQLFSFLAGPLGFVMNWIYQLLQNYGWTIILFTVLVRLLMFPLSIKQQKSTARMSAYQPMIQEIQKKWANDKNKQNQEVQKFYEENNLKMTAGCLPMVVNMLVLFGIIAVIQAPLNYIIRMPEDQVEIGVAIVAQYNAELGIEKSAYSSQSLLIGEIRNPETRHYFTEGQNLTDKDGKAYVGKIDQEWIDKVVDFQFEFLGMDLSRVPTKVPGSELPIYLILPILSVLTMFASQLIIMKTSGTAAQGKSSMLIMTVVMGAMFGFYAFTVPVGFSLYYATSNIVMTVQQLVVKQIYDPEKIRAEVAIEIEERRKAKKAKKKVVVLAEGGVTEEKEVTESELVKLRLARARQMDAERYGETAEEVEAQKQATEKIRLVEAKKAAENENKSGENKAENSEEAKPGRRKRARQTKENEANELTGAADAEKTWVGEELENEQKSQENVDSE